MWFQLLKISCYQSTDKCTNTLLHPTEKENKGVANHDTHEQLNSVSFTFMFKFRQAVHLNVKKERKLSSLLLLLTWRLPFLIFKCFQVLYAFVKTCNSDYPLRKAVFEYLNLWLFLSLCTILTRQWVDRVIGIRYYSNGQFFVYCKIMWSCLVTI